MILNFADQDEKLAADKHGLCGSLPLDRRHHDGLQQELEGNSENQTNRNSGDPVPGPHISNFMPWRTRQPHPSQDQNGADRHNDLTYKNVAGKKDQ